MYSEPGGEGAKGGKGQKWRKAERVEAAAGEDSKGGCAGVCLGRGCPFKMALVQNRAKGNSPPPTHWRCIFLSLFFHSSGVNETKKQKKGHREFLAGEKRREKPLSLFEGGFTLRQRRPFCKAKKEENSILSLGGGGAPASVVWRARVVFGEDILGFGLAKALRRSWSRETEIRRERERGFFAARSRHAVYLCVFFSPFFLFPLEGTFSCRLAFADPSLHPRSFRSPPPPLFPHLLDDADPLFPRLPSPPPVNPFHTAFSCITVSDLLLVDHDGNVVEGGEGVDAMGVPRRKVYNQAA